MHREKEKHKSRQRQIEITKHRLLPPTGELLKQVSVITQIEQLKISGSEIREIEDADFKKLDEYKERGISGSDIDWLKGRLDDEVRSLLNSKYSGKKYQWEVSLLRTNGSGIFAVEGYFKEYLIFTSIGVPWLGKMEDGLKKYKFGDENLRIGPLFHNFGEDTGFSWYAKYELPELDAEIEQEFFFFNNGKFIPYITYKGAEIDCIPLSLAFGIPKLKSVFSMLYSPWNGEKWHKMPVEFKTSTHFADEEGFSIKLNDSAQNVEVLINANAAGDTISYVMSTHNFWFDNHPDACLKGDDIRQDTLAYIHLVLNPSGTHGPWLQVRQVCV